MSDSQQENLLKSILLGLDGPDEAEAFLNAVLTPSEREKIEERLRIFVALLDNLPQRKIAENLNVSITSVSRGARVLKYDSPLLKDLLLRIKEKPDSK